MKGKVLTTLVWRKPLLAAVPVLVFVLLCGLGVFGVAFASEKHVAQQKAYVHEAVSSATANAISNQLEIATFALMATSAYVSRRPLCSDLDLEFDNLSSTIMRWDEKQLVYQIQVLPGAALRYVYPPVSGELARLLIGRDMLQVPQYRNDTLYQIRQRDKRLLLGPYNLLEGFQGMSPAAWTAPARLATQGDFRFRALADQGYRYRLRQVADNINHAATIAASDPLPLAPVSSTINKFNLVWVLEVAPAGGWEPKWRDPCIAAVVVGSFVVSTLVAWLLVAREKHDALLRAMLPRKVISQLQRGEATVVEEFPEPVTILFTDIVSYTEVASQLTALQVVRLLNELYTRFDALCDRHGVYKAFMCVAGCPTREDPISAAVRMAGMAQDMIAMVEEFMARVGDEDMRVKIRIGMHSGPVVAGVIGQRMPRYCLFGMM
ncbi:hypothetical protein GPECTOR_7g1157 [Gonium pectorale]|uniref:Guanylate cyclase domain-containing protein n=1 Tax=Gonium pectorale TaxID=33097 RepID=A0A150GU39_GONPE|nr:hypothetical protein GPECTOR_7g1157 [Gonium pectorale]|eukprot:KXZ53263.1 hypothetical protein GPECTOR_7g1157 [Gonium pectorale]